MSKRTENTSKVSIKFKDGTHKEVLITGTPMIAAYLMSEGAKTGMIVIRDDIANKATCIPYDLVLLIEFQGLTDEEAAKYREEKNV